MNVNQRTVITAAAILIVAIVAIALALIFAFTNGFHDASAIIATMIACGAASPRAAILLASAMVMFGAAVGGSAVAFTIETLVRMTIQHELIYMLAAAVLGAIIWNIMTWRYGLPSSSTQALVGGLLGSTIAAGGFGGVFWGLDELIGPGHQLVGVAKVIVFLFWSILMGLSTGYLFQKVASVALRNKKKTVNRSIRRVQWLTASLLAFSYGANDSQKQMGLIVLILLSGGYIGGMDIPLWVRLLCGAVMLAGVLGGGWRIVKTLGQKNIPNRADPQPRFAAVLDVFDTPVDGRGSAGVLHPGGRLERDGGRRGGQPEAASVGSREGYGHSLDTHDPGRNDFVYALVLPSPLAADERVTGR